jgi:hypothetical protein
MRSVAVPESSWGHEPETARQLNDMLLKQVAEIKWCVGLYIMQQPLLPLIKTSYSEVTV